MQRKTGRGLILDALCLFIVLSGYLCFASMAFSLRDGSGNNCAIQCYCEQSLLWGEEEIFEERCERHNSEENEILKPLFCIVNSRLGFDFASLFRTLAFLPPAHAGILFFLIHIPVRAGPFCNC